MRFTWHELKREATLRRRGLDFAQAEHIFAGPTFTFEDMREDYGELRWVTLGLLREKVIVIVHTETEDEIHVDLNARAERKMNNSNTSPAHEEDERDEYPAVTQADLDRATFRVDRKPARANVASRFCLIPVWSSTSKPKQASAAIRR